MSPRLQAIPPVRQQDRREEWWALFKVGSVKLLGIWSKHTDKALGLIPQAVYYSKVGLELGKLIAHQRNMAPP